MMSGRIWWSRSITVSATSAQVTNSAATDCQCQPKRQTTAAERMAVDKLDDRVARRDLRLAVGALAAQQQVADDRDVLVGVDRRAAVRAGGAGHDEVVTLGGAARCGRGCRRRGIGQHFLRLGPPLPIEHDRQPVDDHVQEAADQQRQQERAAHEQRGAFLEHVDERQMTAPSLKMGRYIATTRPPTSTPRMTMISGSSRLESASTAASTSAS